MKKPAVKKDLGAYVIATPVERDGVIIRYDYEFDIKKFERELAATLKGAKGLLCDNPNYCFYGRIDCGDDLELMIRPERGSKVGQVQISAGVGHKLTHKHAKLPTLKKGVFGSLGFNTNRPLAKLAEQVTLKLIMSSRSQVEFVRKGIEEKEGERAAFVAKCDALMAAFPGLKLEQTDESSISANVYYNASGNYLTGEMMTDGHITIQRLSLPRADQARALFSILASKES